MYSNRSDACIDFLIEKIEGGYNLADPSNFGISERWLKNALLSHQEFPLEIIDCCGCPPIGPDVTRLTRDWAKFFYHWGFWQKYHLSAIPAPLDLVLLCSLVHRETATLCILREALGLRALSGPFSTYVLKRILDRVCAGGETPERFTEFNMDRIKELCSDILLKMRAYYIQAGSQMFQGGYLRRLELVAEEMRKSWLPPKESNNE
jgi:hypothetical protein